MILSENLLLNLSSPVMDFSSTSKLFVSIILMSAGTTLPLPTLTISPTTSSSLFIVLCTPPLITIASFFSKLDNSVMLDISVHLIPVDYHY